MVVVDTKMVRPYPSRCRNQTKEEDTRDRQENGFYSSDERKMPYGRNINEVQRLGKVWEVAIKEDGTQTMTPHPKSF